MNDPDRSGSEFVKAMTLTDATMLVAGSMVGSGIFIVSADIGRTVKTPGYFLATWIAAGVITLLGALAYGELAAMFPRAGGQYVFLRESLGSLTGFLYGWTLFTVIQTGTIAAVSVAFGRFLGVLVPALSPERFSWFPRADICIQSLGCTDPASAIQFGLSPQRVIALLTVWALTIINLRGVREGKFVQTALGAVKAATLGLLIVLGLTVGKSSEAVSANFGSQAPTASAGPAFVVTFGAALVGSLFASDAWNNVTFAAAEVRNPRRNLPLALALGTGIVTAIYVLVNVTYLTVLPLSGTAGAPDVIARGISHATQDRVGTAVAQMIFGSRGEAIMAVAILISAFGCANGMILAGARVYFAMAQDGLFFRRAGELNRHQVPANALIVQAIWTSVLCLSGTYSQLLDYVVFAALLFYVLTTVGLFVLRRKRPDAERPYRAFGYPLLPMLYVFLAAGVAVLLLIAEKTRAQAIGGLFLVLLGIPIFYGWQKVHRA